MTIKAVPAFLIAASFIIQIMQVQAAPAGQPLTLEAIFSGDEFATETLDNLEWRNGGSSFTYLRRDPETGLCDVYQQQSGAAEPTLLLAGESLRHDGEPIAVSEYQRAEDGRFWVLSGPKSVTWDGITEAPHYVYDSRSKDLWPLVDGTNPRNVRLSPDGQRVGYVVDNNLFVADLANKTRKAVTTDGSADIFNAIFDYGSTEFGSTEAWHWSPDGGKIAFWRLDVTEVPTYYLLDEMGKYNTLHALKYPNTGEKHAVNQIGVYNLNSGKTVWMDIGENEDAYFPSLHWAQDSDKLFIQRLSRDHKTLDLLLADADSGKSRVVLTETDPAWIDTTEDLYPLANDEGFVWTSEKDGYRHAYLYDGAGGDVQLTDGDWEVSGLVALDENAGWLYFTAKKESFIEQHVYRVRLDGSGLQKLSSKSGWYEWRVSPDGKFAVENYSNAERPPLLSLKRIEGETVKTGPVLAANDLPALDKYSIPKREFITVETSDGVTLNASITKPSDFDPNKKYPVIAYGYGNAGSQVVVDRWGGHRRISRDMWHRYMADQGFIVFTLDNRTTTGRGKKAKNLTYKHYHKYAVLDQIEGVKQLKNLPYVDGDRIGFWGWSGGGYLAAALMTKGAPHYKVGVSVAPVIDLTRYQAVGVERWMSSIEDNQEGYDAVNLINFADRLEGKLLLIHGTGDENVKFAYTLQFADALIKANKQFDMMVYPNERHPISGAQLHVFTKIRDYFVDNL